MLLFYSTGRSANRDFGKKDIGPFQKKYKFMVLVFFSLALQGIKSLIFAPISLTFCRILS